MGLFIVALLALLGLPNSAAATTPSAAAALPIALEHRPMLIADLYPVAPVSVPVLLHAPILTAPATQPYRASAPAAMPSAPSPSMQSAPASAPLPASPPNTLQTYPATAPVDSFATTVESDVLAGMNAARADAGLAPLAESAALSGIARAHSADMLAQNYFSHTDKSGCDGACRLTNAGFSWSSMGENIHMMSGYDYDPAQTAQKIIADWMASPPHRANILNSTFTAVGVGIASQGSTVYTTADFALPR